MRIFIAVDIDRNILDEIADLQQQIRRARGNDKGLKWVSTENMHLTIKFIGQVKDNIVNDICKAVERASQKHSKFELEIKKLGSFGGKSARVLWVGTGEGSENLAELAWEVDEGLSGLDFPKETRRFTGHLTLCRIKNYRAGIEMAEAAEQQSNFEASVSIVDSVTVYQSELTKQGPIYTALANYKLMQ